MQALSRLIVISFFFIAQNSLAQDMPQTMFETGVVTEKTALTETFEWGTLITYYSGESRASQDTLSGIAIIKPGMEIHPPHVHAEEEYMLIMEGEGTWSILGEESPARAGDVMFAKPWDIHGITNTGSSSLTFYFIKWNPKPVEPMDKPGQ